MEAACLRPDASLFSIKLPLRSLVVQGTSNLAECGERLAQQLSFGHFGVPAGVVPPDLRLCNVAGVSVMVLQMRNLEKGYVLAVKPSKGLPPFPTNSVADKMLQNQQLHVFGSALVVRHTYVGSDWDQQLRPSLCRRGGCFDSGPTRRYVGGFWTEKRPKTTIN